MAEIKGIIFDWVGTLYERGVGLLPYSRKVLKSLKQRDYKLGLVSLAKNGVGNRRRELENSGILPLFDSVIVETIKTKKQYLKCMKEMMISPRTTAIVDDRTVRGIKIGNELGCQTYWVRRGEYANEVPDHETGAPTEIIVSVEDLEVLL
jgi:FMN phosphatase YigB (HAD superfamily)